MKCHYKSCNYKVNTFTHVECICGFYFCKYHNHTFEHECDKTTEIKKDNQNKIKRENPLLKKKNNWNLDF